eukprot:g32780.t1
MNVDRITFGYHILNIYTRQPLTSGRDAFCGILSSGPRQFTRAKKSGLKKPAKGNMVNGLHKFHFFCGNRYFFAVRNTDLRNFNDSCGLIGVRNTDLRNFNDSCGLMFRSPDFSTAQTWFIYLAGICLICMCCCGGFTCGFFAILKATKNKTPMQFIKEVAARRAKKRAKSERAQQRKEGYEHINGNGSLRRHPSESKHTRDPSVSKPTVADFLTPRQQSHTINVGRTEEIDGRQVRIEMGKTPRSMLSNLRTKAPRTSYPEEDPYYPKKPQQSSSQNLIDGQGMSSSQSNFHRSGSGGYGSSQPYSPQTGYSQPHSQPYSQPYAQKSVPYENSEVVDPEWDKVHDLLSELKLTSYASKLREAGWESLEALRSAEDGDLTGDHVGMKKGQARMLLKRLESSALPVVSPSNGASNELQRREEEEKTRQKAQEEARRKKEEEEAKRKAAEEKANPDWAQVARLLSQMNLLAFSSPLQEAGFDSLDALRSAEPDDLTAEDIGMKIGQARLLLKKLDTFVDSPASPNGSSLEQQRKAEEEEARLKAEAQRKAEEEAWLKVEAEARLKAEAEARMKAEEARLKAEEMARKKKAEEEARKKAEEEARRKAEEEKRRQAEEEKLKAAKANPGWQQVTRLLSELNFSAFAEQIKEAGFDSLEALQSAEADDLTGDDVGMKKGQARLLIKKANSESAFPDVDDSTTQAAQAAAAAQEAHAAEAAQAKTLSSSDEEMRLRVEQEIRRKLEEETAQKKLEAEMRSKKALEEFKRDAEEEARRKRDTEAAQKKYEEAVRKKIEAEMQNKKAEEEAKLQAEEARLKKEEEAKRRAEEARLKKEAEEEARLQAAAAAKQREEEEARKKAEEEEARRKEEARQKEEDARRKAEEAARRKAEIEAKMRADIEAKMRAEVEAEMWAKEEARQRAAEEARQKEAEARRKAEAEAVAARLRAEEEARKKAEEAVAARLRAEEEARKKAEEARLKAEEEARKKAEEARLKAEEEARKKAEEEARKKKAETEAQAQADEEEKMKEEVEQRVKAEMEARIKAEVEARIRAEIEAKMRAEAASPGLRVQTSSALCPHSQVPAVCMLCQIEARKRTILRSSQSRPTKRGPKLRTRGISRCWVVPLTSSGPADGNKIESFLKIRNRNPPSSVQGARSKLGRVLTTAVPDCVYSPCTFCSNGYLL